MDRSFLNYSPFRGQFYITSGFSLDPEQNVKLFLSAAGDPSSTLFYSDVEKFYGLWQKFDAAHWRQDSSFLPYQLSSEERKTALQELKAIPEVFYSTMKLPVITPDNV